MGNLNVDLSSQEAQIGFDCLAPGWYNATVVDSEIKTGGSGKPYINWTWSIDGKPNMVWEIMCPHVDFHMRNLKTMAVSCGHNNPEYIADTDELHGLSCSIKLKIEVDDTGTYDDKNKITAYKPISEAPKTATAPKAEAKPAATDTDKDSQDDTAKKPWE